MAKFAAIGPLPRTGLKPWRSPWDDASRRPTAARSSRSTGLHNFVNSVFCAELSETALVFRHFSFLTSAELEAHLQKRSGRVLLDSSSSFCSCEIVSPTRDSAPGTNELRRLTDLLDSLLLECFSCSSIHCFPSSGGGLSCLSSGTSFAMPQEVRLHPCVCASRHHLQHQHVDPRTNLTRLAWLQKGEPAGTGQTFDVARPLMARLMSHHAVLC